MTDDLMSYQEIADLFGVDVNAVRMWQYRKLIPPPVRRGPGPGKYVHINMPLWRAEDIYYWGEAIGRLEPREGVEYEPPKQYRPPGAETGFEREMRLAREAARK